MTANSSGTDLDLVIVGGGIGGVICLKYARDAGLNALLLERAGRVGGIWRDLPAWQDLQIRKEDWTLGDLPIAGEDQASILGNIEAWVERFNLAPHIRLNSAVTSARPTDTGWRVTTGSAEYQPRWLIAATGGHGRPVIPPVERGGVSLTEYHSSALRRPEELVGRRVTVVGGGASAYDLLELCFVHGASSVSWVYRSTRWMRPTRQKKYIGASVRWLARCQMLGLPVTAINRLVNRELKARYTRAGLDDIKPPGEFDFRRDQFIPGRARMIENFGRIARYRSEVQALRGNTVQLASGDTIEADLLLWGTGYDIDMGWLGLDVLSHARPNDISRRCYTAFRSMDAPNLFLLAPAVLETSTSTPWAYAHAARSMMAHIKGRPVFETAPRQALLNHFDVAKLLAARDRGNFPPVLWYLKYLWLALFHPSSRPLPIP